MRKFMLAAVAAGALLAGCGSSPDSPTPAETTSAKTATGSPTPPPELKVEIGAVVSLHCQTEGKTRADFGYPGGGAKESGYKISRSVAPKGEDVVLGTFTGINKKGCTFSYMVATNRVGSTGPALLAQPNGTHWKLAVPASVLAESGFAPYEVHVKPGAVSYLLFRANKDTRKSKPITLFGYEAGSYSDLKESPDELLK